MENTFQMAAATFIFIHVIRTKQNLVCVLNFSKIPTIIVNFLNLRLYFLMSSLASRVRGSDSILEGALKLTALTQQHREKMNTLTS